MRPSLLPNGHRLVAGSPAKLRCLSFLSLPGSTVAYDGAQFTTNWNPSYILLQLQTAKALGANAIRYGAFLSPGVTIDDFTLRSRFRQVWAMCRQVGIYVYLTMSDGDLILDPTAHTYAGAYSALVKKWFGWHQQDAADIVVAADVSNEFGNNERYGTWGTNYAQVQSDMALYIADVRQACSFPLTASMYVNSAAALSPNVYFTMVQALGLDFFDVHPYYTDGTFPTPAGFAAFIARYITPTGKSFLVGEIGYSAVNQPLSISEESWFDGVGDIARMPQCFGANFFTLSDNAGVPSGGMFASGDTTFSAPRAKATGPFGRWPAL